MNSKLEIDVYSYHYDELLAEAEKERLAKSIDPENLIGRGVWFLQQVNQVGVRLVKWGCQISVLIARKSSKNNAFYPVEAPCSCS